MVGELGRVRFAGRFERLADALVQAHAAARALALVERLADERVRVGEAVDLVGLADQAGLQRLLQRGQHVAVDQRLQQRQVELAADDRRHAQHLVGLLAEPGQAAREHLLHAVGHRDPAQRALLQLRQRPQRLLDEERVALGLVGEPAHELRAGGRAHERARLVRGEPGQRDLLERRLAADAGRAARRGRRRGRWRSPAAGRGARRRAGARAAASCPCRPSAGRRRSAPPGAAPRRTSGGARRPRTAASGPARHPDGTRGRGAGGR